MFLNDNIFTVFCRIFLLFPLKFALFLRTSHKVLNFKKVVNNYFSGVFVLEVVAVLYSAFIRFPDILNW